MNKKDKGTIDEVTGLVRTKLRNIFLPPVITFKQKSIGKIKRIKFVVKKDINLDLIDKI